MNPPRSLICVRFRQFFSVLLVASVLNAAPAAEPALKPLYPRLAPVGTPEALRKLSLPNTTIESVVVDEKLNTCLVTAIVTHPPATNRTKVWVGLPLTNWNGRFQGTGGGGFVGGNPGGVRGPVARGFSAGATDTGHEGGSGSFALDASGWRNCRLALVLGTPLPCRVI